MNYMRNISGQYFGELYAVQPYSKDSRGNIVWEFECSCGNKVYKTYPQVSRIKGIASCGCVYSPKGQFKNLVGKRFGKLTVIAFSHKNSHSHCIWKCQCDCGNYHLVDTNLLTTEHTKSCGKCSYDLVGKYFGKLMVEKKGKVVNGTQTWLCRCECGNEHIVTTHLLLSGGVSSCGCYAREQLSMRNKARSQSLRLMYPGWFINDLCDNGDKERAISGELFTCERVKFVCNSHGIYEQRVADHITLSTGERRSGCPICNKYVASIGSKKELEIKDFVESLSDVTFSKARLLNNKEIDLYSDKLKLGIEYNGSHFHATVNSLYNNKSYDYHRNKFLLAKEKGIHLVTIFDVDWEQNQDKIKMYLSSLFSPQKRLMARKCIVRKIDDDLACEFIDKYHIQGSNKSMMKINYGLFYSGELYAVMSFGKLRLNKTQDGHYELHRYCVKEGYTVVGGASKLLKAFEREYSPSYILSYSDNDYFLGDIYKRLGFEDKGQCKPRYYWYLHGKEIKRERCMLKRLKIDYPELLQEAYDNEAKNKEDYVMTHLDACKVYRSGNTKWEKRYNLCL